MKRTIGRRTFVSSAAAAGLAVATPGTSFGRGPTLLVPRATKPWVVASSNGHRYRNGGQRTCVEEAFARMAKGEDVLDALIAGVNIVELDPEESSVGYGGLPNADGVVQLDASCMHGPTGRGAGVAAVEGVRTPSRLAKAVMDETDHVLLVGRGAQDFARLLGFEIERDLNTDRSRSLFLEWKRRIDPQHWLDPAKRSEAAESARRQMLAEGLVAADHLYGTINCNGVNAQGDLAGVTTTSGLAFKIPGRVGDSPILGAGLYVDGQVGAAGSTGRGEANLMALASFLIVEEMRRGRHPLDAGMEALRRIRDNTKEKRLLTADGQPAFGLAFYVLNRSGEHAGVSMWGGKNRNYAVCGEDGPALLSSEPLIPREPPQPD